MADAKEGCVMLALSTFRKSEEAVNTAMQYAREVKKLCIVFVADENLARYYIASEVPASLRGSYEEELLEFDEKEGLAQVEEIAAKARLEGIEIKSIVKIGRFAHICLDCIKQEKPSLVVTTRSQRPEWVKRFFGSPVNKLVDYAGCPVVVI